MDPERRAFLEALRTEMGAIEQRAIARDAETRETLRAEIKAAREEALQGFEAASSQAGALNDKALAAIKALGDGLAMHREAVERHAEDRERALMNAHVLPLEASAANFDRRISTLEKR